MSSRKLKGNPLVMPHGHMIVNALCQRPTYRKKTGDKNVETN